MILKNTRCMKFFDEIQRRVNSVKNVDYLRFSRRNKNIQINRVKNNKMPSAAETWGYGTLAVTIISLTSLFGIVLVGFISKKSDNGKGLLEFERRFEMIKIG